MLTAASRLAPNHVESVDDLEREQVILVDASDRAIGTASKLSAHRDGRLHRAVSVLLFDPRGNVLLQRRAGHKYHSPGLWSNSCCGHPRPGETASTAAERRLQDELGMTCALRHAATFLYHADLGSGMHEHEIDHVFVGHTGTVPSPNPAEVADWRYASLSALDAEIRESPRSFTIWLPLVLRQVFRPHGGGIDHRSRLSEAFAHATPQ
jgi:isopentenyl-diphosphate delta-isomerase